MFCAVLAPKKVSEHGASGAPFPRCPTLQSTREFLIRQVLSAPIIKFFLERGLADAGDLALVSQLTEADTAHAIVTQVSVGAAAQLAAVVLTGRELSRGLLLQDHRLLSHFSSPP